jgi:nucleotidyltransferase substrate binding protein (TIGR01987 family)
MPEFDIRWKQRFENYQKALKQLTDIVNVIDKDKVSDIELFAIIKTFELTFELAWQTMKDYLSYKSVAKRMIGSRDAIRSAMQEGLIENGQYWINMIDDRNLAAHTYDEDKANELTEKILNIYYAEFIAFQTKMETME